MLYQIEATDADGDELEYKLVTPLDLGIDLDVKTGLISWTISTDILSLIEAKKSTNEKRVEAEISDSDRADAMTIDIHVQVSDGDGGIEVRKFILEYLKNKQKPILRFKDDIRY